MKSGLEFDLPAEPLEAIEPIARASVEHRVAQTLREMIVTGKLPAGTPLVQRELAERLGVSQTPVRLALMELERDGLVAVGETGRAIVSRLTREDLEELYAARYGLEGLAARAGAPRVTDIDLAAMHALLEDLDAYAAAQDVDDYLSARWDFHSICYLASGRTRLVAEVERLFWRGDRYHRLVLSSPERFGRSVGNYHAFLEACEARDPDRAEAVVQDSIRWAVSTAAPTLPSEVEDMA